MNTLYLALNIEISVILFILIFGSLTRQYKAKCTKILVGTMALCIVASVCDGISYFDYPANIAAWIPWLVSYVSWLGGDMMLLLFTWYSYIFISNRAKVNKWLFYVPMMIMGLCLLQTTYDAAVGRLFVYEHGVATYIGQKSAWVSLMNLLFVVYLPIVAACQWRKIGVRPVFLLGVYGLIPFCTYACTLLFGIMDYSFLGSALSLIVVYIFLENHLGAEREREQRLQIEKAYEEQEAQLEEIHTLNQEIEREKRRQERYHDIISHSGNGVWTIIVREGAAPAMECDAKMCSLLGIDPQAKLTPERVYDFWYSRITPEAVATVQASVAKMMEGQVDENTYLWTHPTKGNIYVRCGGSARRRADGSYRLSGYHADVTNIVLAEKQHAQVLRQARDEAEAANQAKTSFLFNMSHDIRTPMNAIIGFTNLLRKHQDDPEKRASYLEKIEGSSTVLLSIINNVLEMARIEKGTIEIDETAWSAEQFNDTLYSIFHEMMRQKGLEFTRKIEVKHPYVMCDPTKLREIFINILSNAYKYTNSGGKVNMLLDEVSGPREGYAYYRTTITDTGIGMSEEFLPHLFDEFSRENNTTENKIEGTGLGMPIVKRLVEMMQGTIEVSSQKGVGTTFVVTIPHKITDRSNLVEHAGVILDPKIFRGKRILLAEDNDLNAEIAIEILSEVGFIIERAEDGARCVEMLQKAGDNYYDVILMDIQMPNMNGYEATRAIRIMDNKTKAHIPILAMTANAFEEDKREASRTGMNGHLAKPINVTELMKALACNLR